MMQQTDFLKKVNLFNVSNVSTHLDVVVIPQSSDYINGSSHTQILLAHNPHPPHPPIPVAATQSSYYLLQEINISGIHYFLRYYRFNVYTALFKYLK